MDGLSMASTLFAPLVILVKGELLRGVAATFCDFCGSVLVFDLMEFFIGYGLAPQFLVRGCAIGCAVGSPSSLLDVSFLGVGLERSEFSPRRCGGMHVRLAARRVPPRAAE